MHPDNEPLLLNILTVLNIPAVIVSIIISIALILTAGIVFYIYDETPNDIYVYTSAYQIVEFTCWAIQWQLLVTELKD